MTEKSATVAMNDPAAIGAALKDQLDSAVAFLASQPVAIDPFLRLLKGTSKLLHHRVQMAQILARMVKELPEGALAATNPDDVTRTLAMTYENAAALVRDRLARVRLSAFLYRKFDGCGIFATDEEIVRFKEMAMVVMVEITLQARRSATRPAAHMAVAA